MCQTLPEEDAINFIILFSSNHLVIYFPQAEVPLPGLGADLLFGAGGNAQDRQSLSRPQTHCHS